MSQRSRKRDEWGVQPSRRGPTVYGIEVSGNASESMVWYGMVWYGMVWCGVVWCGVVWCGVVWCGVVWCGVVWCGVVWYGMVWYGMVWCGVVWCGVVWYGVVWCGVVWCGVVWCGVVWCGVVWYGMVWYGMASITWHGMAYGQWRRKKVIIGGGHNLASWGERSGFFAHIFIIGGRALTAPPFLRHWWHGMAWHDQKEIKNFLQEDIPNRQYLASSALVFSPELRHWDTDASIYIHRTPLCPVPPQLLSNFDKPASPPEDLKNCFDDDCGGEKGEEDCYSLRSCTWCVYSKSKSVRLEEPYCISSEKCYGGVQGW